MNEPNHPQAVQAGPAPGAEPEDETPGYWQVRAALAGAVGALNLISASDRNALTEIARSALADVDIRMTGQEPHPAEAKLAAVRAHIEHRAREVSADLFPVRPQDIRVNSGDILAILDGREPAGQQ